MTVSKKTKARTGSIANFIIAIVAAFFLGKHWGMIWSAAEDTYEAFGSPQDLIWHVVILGNLAVLIYKTFGKRRGDD